MTLENKPEPKNSPSAREIEVAIGDTRAALSDDIKALSDKTSPTNLKNEAKQAVKNVKDNVMDKAADKGAELKERALEIKDAAVEKAYEAKELAADKAYEAGEAISDVAVQTRDLGRVAWRFATDNAVPLGLIGLGAGWLISNQRSTSPRFARPDVGWGEEMDEQDYPAFATDEYPVRARASRRNADKSVATKLRDNTRSAYDKAEHSLAASMQRVQRRSRDVVEANPLAFAFGTLLAGIGVGLLLPSTAREERLLEPARARVRGAIGSAREAAHDVGQVAKHAAQETVARATGEASARS